MGVVHSKEVKETKEIDPVSKTVSTQTHELALSDIHLSCWKGEIEAVKNFISIGVNIDIPYHISGTALTFQHNDYFYHSGFRNAIWKGDFDFDFSDDDEDEEFHQFDIYDRRRLSLYGTLPLYWAVVKGHTGIVNILLNAGANINAGDLDGETALHGAASKGHDAILRLLLQHDDVELDKLNYFQETPLLNACQADCIDSVRMLVEAGANLHCEKQHNTEINRCPHKQAISPLVAAILNKNMDMLRFLVDAGADVNHGHNNNWALGTTPMQMIVYGCSNMSDEKACQMLAILIEGGANIIAKSSQLLEIYIRYGFTKCVEFFISKGIKVNLHVPGNDFLSPLHTAVIFGRLEIVKILLSNGADYSRLYRPICHGVDNWTPLAISKNPQGFYNDGCPRESVVLPSTLERYGEISDCIEKHLRWLRRRPLLLTRAPANATYATHATNSTVDGIDGVDGVDVENDNDDNAENKGEELPRNVTTLGMLLVEKNPLNQALVRKIASFL